MKHKHAILFVLFVLVLATLACDGSVADDPGPTATSTVHTMSVPLGNQSLGVMRARWYQAHPGCYILQDAIIRGKLVISYECE